MKIAIEGCCHGQLDDIYGSIKLLEQKEGIKVDLVLICGDFQAVRNVGDLECMSVPPKYRHLGTFWKYYAGIAKAPYPTIFIGGNHEASNYLWELYHGGWVCDNIYYLGAAGVIQYNGVRIGGISGIFKQKYETGHYEVSPYSPSDVRSAYYVREYDVNKLLQVKQPMDVFLSHDWPRGVERYGDLDALLRTKPFFRAEATANTLGSRANEELLTHLKPSYWFAAHLHVKFAAFVPHDKWVKQTYSQVVRDILSGKQHGRHANRPPVKQHNPDEIAIDDDDDEDNEQMPQNMATQLQDMLMNGNPDEIAIDDDDDDSASGENEQNTSKPAAVPVTRFLSLDKCLPRRSFLQVVDVPAKNDEGFQYDLEWLAIAKVMNPYLSLQYQPIPTPPADQLQTAIQTEVAQLQTTVDLKMPLNFKPTHTAHDPHKPITPEDVHRWMSPVENPQTKAFCAMLGMENKINAGKAIPEAPMLPSVAEPASYTLVSPDMAPDDVHQETGDATVAVAAPLVAPILDVHQDDPPSPSKRAKLE